MKRNHSAYEVPISAMIDVVFLLLVFFILTAEETVNEAWVTIYLPGSSEVKNENLTLDVNVLKDGYELAGQKMSLEKIERKFNLLAETLSDRKDLTINVRVSKIAKHEDLVMLLDILNKLNLKKFNLHTLK